MDVIKVFQLSDTLNNRLNAEKLTIEVRTSTISVQGEVKDFGGEVQIRFPQELTAAEMTVLQGIVAQHDGEKADVTDALVDDRERKVRELTQMSLYHPLLDNIKTTEYLTSIDNHINAYIRSGVSDVLVTKIIADAASPSHPQNVYLNQIVTTAGNTVAQFFIGKILE